MFTRFSINMQKHCIGNVCLYWYTVHPYTKETHGNNTYRIFVYQERIIPKHQKSVVGSLQHPGILCQLDSPG